MLDRNEIYIVVIIVMIISNGGKKREVCKRLYKIFWCS